MSDNHERYEYLPAGWREVCELLADIRDQLQRDRDTEINEAVYEARQNW